MTADPIGWSDAGRIDTQVARAVIKAGHPIVIRNSARRRERQPRLRRLWRETLSSLPCLYSGSQKC